MSILIIALAIVCMCLMWYFAEYNGSSRSEAPTLQAQRTAYARRTSVYFYVILAVALFWLLLLSTQDLSAFLYFQF